MGRPHRKFGTDTRVVGARFTPEEIEMMNALRRKSPNKSNSDVVRACLETVYLLRNEDETIEGLFQQIMRGE